MELLQLQYFYEVAKRQHMTKAAERLHISQPSLTQSIHRLERELNVPLFRSSGRNIVLTEYGTYLKNRLEPILQALAQLPEELEEMAQISQNHICVNVLAASELVTRALIAYKKANPEINFRIVQNKETEHSDITIFTRPFYQLNAREKQNTYIFTEKIFMAVPKTSPYAKYTECELHAFADDEFISLAGSRNLRNICDRFCMHAGFAPKIIFESDSPSTVKDLIAEGMGIGFWPQYTWGPVNHSDIVLVPLKAPICQRDIIITYHEQKRDNEEVRKYYEFLTEYFENLRRKKHPESKKITMV